MTVRDRISRVVQQWFLGEPLLFAVWTAHTLKAEPRIQTIRVRHGLVEYNPEFIRALKRPQLAEVLRVEALRILLKHPYERRRENPELSYAASNLTLQEYLRTSLPLPLARDIFGDGSHDRQFFEYYYNQLIDAADPPARDEPGGASDTKPLGKGELGSGDPSASDGLGNSLDFYANSSLAGEENAENWDSNDLLNEIIDDRIRTAHETKTWGTIAGRLRERILAGLRPKMDYRAMLRQFRASVLSVRRRLTRMKPNRRYGFLHMGSRYDFTTKLLFAVDVSGSMSHDELRQGFSAVNQLFKYGVQAIDVVQFDTELRGPPESWRSARREVVTLGRGGTNFSPMMSFIDDHPEYDGAVIYTDGYAPVPKPPLNRRTRLFWLFCTESSYRAMAPDLKSLGPVAFIKESAHE